MSAAERFDEMPEAIVEAFRRKPLMPFLELAALLRVNRTTLRDHVNAGDLPWRQKGLGTKAPRRVFTLADVAELFRNLRRKSETGQVRCQDHQSAETGAAILPFAARTSSAAAPPTSGISDSSSAASGVAARATPKTSARRKSSPQKSKPKRKSKHRRIERPDLAQ